MVALVLRGRLMNGAVVPPLSTYDIIWLAVAMWYNTVYLMEQNSSTCAAAYYRSRENQQLSIFHGKPSLWLACPPGPRSIFLSYSDPANL
jgi:hypothetical protein